MEHTMLDNKNTETTFAQLAAKAAEGKMLVEDFAEIGKRKAKSLISQGRESGADCLDETTHYVKHHPWQSIGIAAGTGAFVGVLFGWTCARICR